MIDKPTKIGNSELYTARVLNMAVAQYFGLMKEYAEITLESGKVALTRVNMKRDTKKFNNLVWSFHTARKAS